MKNETLVSVIVPVYNVEKYLARAIESIQSQTYQNVEIILVDDGSKDESGAICETYAKNDPRIKVIHKENGGLSSARNAGIDVAKGNYVVFVDSDDCIRDEMLEKMLETAKDENCDIVQCEFCRFTTVIPAEKISGRKKCISGVEALQFIDTPVYMAAWNKLYKRELFHHIRFPEGKIHEDVGCTYRLFYESEKVAVLEDDLYCYYINNDSITTGKIKLNKLDLLDAYIGQVLFFEEKKLTGLMQNANNNLAACFGTLLSYERKKYMDYKAFYNEMEECYRSIRKEVLLAHPLRIDLKLVTVLSFGHLWLPVCYHNIKRKIHKLVK